MAWSTPKTDWHGAVVDGQYVGDYFSFADFNRIKNNLAELKTLVDTLYNNPTYPWYDLGANRTYSQYMTIDDINGIGDNLYNLNRVSVSAHIGKRTKYTEETTLTYKDLNRIEKACLTIYECVQNAAAGRRKLTWNFGKGMDF